MIILEVDAAKGHAPKPRNRRRIDLSRPNSGSRCSLQNAPENLSEIAKVAGKLKREVSRRTAGQIGRRGHRAFIGSGGVSPAPMKLGVGIRAFRIRTSETRT